MCPMATIVYSLRQAPAVVTCFLRGFRCVATAQCRALAKGFRLPPLILHTLRAALPSPPAAYDTSPSSPSSPSLFCLEAIGSRPHRRGKPQEKAEHLHVRPGSLHQRGRREKTGAKPSGAHFEGPPRRRGDEVPDPGEPTESQPIAGWRRGRVVHGGVDESETSGGGTTTPGVHSPHAYPRSEERPGATSCAIGGAYAGHGEGKANPVEHGGRRRWGVAAG